MSRLRWVVLPGAGVLVLGLAVSPGPGGIRRRSRATAAGLSATTTGGWGETAYVGITFPGDNASGSVTIHGAVPHGLADSTGASLAYYLCTPKADPAGAAVGVGSESDAREWCSDLVPADGAPLSLTQQQLVVALTPSTEGVVAFEGLDLHYSDGWQNGTQRVGGDVRIQVRDHS